MKLQVKYFLPGKQTNEYLDEFIAEYDASQLHRVKYGEDHEFQIESDGRLGDQNQEFRHALLCRLLETDAKNDLLVCDLIVQYCKMLSDSWTEVEEYKFLCEKLLKDTGVEYLRLLLWGISDNFDLWEGKYSVLVDSALVVEYLDRLITQYDESHFRLIEFICDEDYYFEISGGCLDLNEDLRHGLLYRLLETDARNDQLVSDLFLEIGKWSAKKRGIIRGYERLGAKLLRDTGTKYLNCFTEGISASFDAWRNCFAMDVDERLRKVCLNYCEKLYRNPETDEELRFMTGNSIKLFQALGKKE